MMDLAGVAVPTASRTVRGVERRAGRRFEVAFDLRWKLLSGKQLRASDTGRTINISSSGLLFQTSRELPVGAALELSISWPVLLRNVAPLQLRIIGEVVRNGSTFAAVRMRHHEFRTVALATR